MGRRGRSMVREGETWEGEGEAWKGRLRHGKGKVSYGKGVRHRMVTEAWERKEKGQGDEPPPHLPHTPPSRLA